MNIQRAPLPQRSDSQSRPRAATARRPRRAAAPALKVGWLTPFGPRSDIGAFSRAILGASARLGADSPLDLVPMINENGPTYFHAGPMLGLDGSTDEELLQSFDAVVYNIGNNAENHAHINRLALRYPGVIVVHDLVMQHYVAWEVFERLRDPAVYADLIAAHYGTAGLERLAASRICAGNGRARYAPWDSQHAISMPLVEPFLRTAAAVVVHSDFAEAQVRRFADVPLIRLGLPHDQKPALSDAEVAAWARATRRRDRVTFAAFGYINRGKCLRLLIEAFRARPELARRARLTIAGYPTDEGHANELVELVRALDLSEVVRFEFAAPSERLQQLKRDADVFVNLRWPNTESASASLVEQLNAGKPTLVYATGCYAEVPPDACFRVDRINSVEALAETMLEAAADADRRIAVGLAGREHARRISAEGYVRKLGDFLREERPMLRSRQAMHGRLRAIDPAQLAGQAGGSGPSWARDVAVARDTMAAILEGTSSLAPRNFLLLDDTTLRSFIAIGPFAQPEPAACPELMACLDRQLMASGRLGLYRAVRQAVAAKRLIEGAGGTPEELGTPDPAAMELLACLGPELFAAAGYLLVLGRVPGPGEADGYALRLSRGEPPTAVVREILGSEEAVQRNLPAATIERLQAGATLAAEILRPATAAGPELAPGEAIQLGSATPAPGGLLLGPWHGLEPDGVWSAGGIARLAFRIAAGSPAELRAKLHLRVPVGQGGPRPLRVFVNGMLVHAAEVLADGWRDLTVPLTAQPGPAGTPVTLTLDAGLAIAASELCNAEDPRRLGVMLARIELLPTETSLLPDDSILLEPDGTIDFFDRRPSEAMLAEGWHLPERDGVWTDGPRAVLRLATPPMPAPGQLRLTFGLPPEASGTGRSITLVLDGIPYVHQADPLADSATLALPVPAAAEQRERRLEIECDGAFIPSMLAVSDDDRRLGIRLLELGLVLGPEGAA